MLDNNTIKKENSYKGIVKTTGLIAIVQVVQIVFGLIRNKVVAILLGTTGFGVWGMYTVFIEMVTAFSSLGIDQSGVREIAKTSDDSDKISKIIWIFNKALLVLSIIFSIVTIIFSKQVSNSLFNDESYYWGVIMTSLTILLTSLSKGQKAILNGLRDMKGLAMSQIYGAIIGSVACIILVYALGVNGIPLFLFVVALTAFLSTSFYVRRLKIKTIKPSKTEVKVGLTQLLKLGLGFSGALIIASIMTYLSRVYLSNHYSLGAVGIYQASFTIANLYIGMILTAMGVDFMPRIMKLTQSKDLLNKAINEQIELGVTVACIGIICVIVFSPLVLYIFYSSEFSAGVSIIRWQILGVGMRIIAFPFSYVIMAKNKPLIYVLIQAIFWVLDYLLLILFSNLFGFDGLGINYCVAYALYLLMAWYTCYKLVGFRFSPLAIKIISTSFAVIGIVWLIAYFLSTNKAYIVGSIAIIGTTIWVNHNLTNHMGLSIIKIIKNKIKR